MPESGPCVSVSLWTFGDFPLGPQRLHLEGRQEADVCLGPWLLLAHMLFIFSIKPEVGEDGNRTEGNCSEFFLDQQWASFFVFLSESQTFCFQGCAEASGHQTF